MAYLDPANSPLFDGKDRKSLTLLGLDVYAGMKMVGAQLSEGPREDNGDVQGRPELRTLRFVLSISKVTCKE